MTVPVPESNGRNIKDRKLSKSLDTINHLETRQGPPLKLPAGLVVEILPAAKEQSAEMRRKQLSAIRRFLEAVQATRASELSQASSSLTSQDHK